MRDVRLAVLNYLFQECRYRKSEAHRILNHLEKGAFERTEDRGLRQALKDAWTDYQL